MSEFNIILDVVRLKKQHYVAASFTAAELKKQKKTKLPMPVVKALLRAELLADKDRPGCCNIGRIRACTLMRKCEDSSFVYDEAIASINRGEFDVIVDGSRLGSS